MAIQKFLNQNTNGLFFKINDNLVKLRIIMAPNENEFINNHRKNFLIRVMQEKERLFGRLSGTLTKQDIDAIWKQIRDDCVQDGAVMWATKSIEDMKKNVWGYMKQTALRKKDGRTTTGKGGGTSSVLNEVRNLIIAKNRGKSHLKYCSNLIIRSIIWYWTSWGLTVQQSRVCLFQNLGFLPHKPKSMNRLKKRHFSNHHCHLLLPAPLDALI